MLSNLCHCRRWLNKKISDVKILVSKSLILWVCSLSVPVQRWLLWHWHPVSHWSCWLCQWMRLWVTHAYTLLQGQGKECVFSWNILLGISELWLRNKCAFFLYVFLVCELFVCFVISQWYFLSVLKWIAISYLQSNFFVEHTDSYYDLVLLAIQHSSMKHWITDYFGVVVNTKQNNNKKSLQALTKKWWIYHLLCISNLKWKFTNVRLKLRLGIQSQMKFLLLRIYFKKSTAPYRLLFCFCVEISFFNFQLDTNVYVTFPSKNKCGN